MHSKVKVSDSIVGELLKYGGVRYGLLVGALFRVVWQEEVVPKE